MAIAMLFGVRAFEQEAFDLRFDGQRAHFLAHRPSILDAVDAASIDGMVARRAAVAQVHAPTAAPADRNALQQRRSLAWRAAMTGFVAAGIVHQSPLVLHELLPVNVAGMGGLEADLPVCDRDFGRSRVTNTVADPAALLAALTIDIGSSITGIGEC